MKFIKVKAKRVTENSQTEFLQREIEVFINPNLIKTIDYDYQITLMDDEYNVHDNLIKIGVADYEVRVINHADCLSPR